MISAKIPTIYVFHDESLPNKSWLLIGLIFVNEQYLKDINDCLLTILNKENYRGEIHFCGLPKSFDGPWGAKARVAKRWLNVFETNLCEYANFSILAVNKGSPAFDKNKFKKDFHCYNRFTAMALKAGISWHISRHNYDEIKIIFISDKKDRCSRPNDEFIDNFEDYLPYRSQLDSFLSKSRSIKYPRIREMKLILEDSANCLLIQLCDVLLGSTQSALVCNTNRETKLELGRIILSWYHDLNLLPWEQKLKLHRRVNFWLFPNEDGQPDRNIPFKLDVNPNQLKLFT